MHIAYAKDLSGAQKLSDDTDTGQAQSETEAHADTVKNRSNHFILGSISLCTAQNNTVYNDQRDIDTQR